MDDGAEEHLQQKGWRWVCWVKRVTCVYPAARIRLCLKHGAHENACASFACTRLDQVSFDVFGHDCADTLVSRQDRRRQSWGKTAAEAQPTAIVETSKCRCRWELVINVVPT